MLGAVNAGAVVSDDTPAASSSVRVAVRIRPLVAHEITERCGECVSVNESNRRQVVVGSSDTGFTFDHVFSQETSQQDIYQQCVVQLVSAAFEGFNATVLAYGQTGSGKTYTMGSSSTLRVQECDRGIIPRVIEDIFETIDKKRAQDPNCQYKVSVQFLEIYGEEVKDLLDPLNRTVVIRENDQGEIVVLGAKEEEVRNEEEMMLMLERGSLCRTTGSTLMNAQSSRSHAIFTMLLENRISRGAEDSQAARGQSQPSQRPIEVRKSKFHFVDLAGSERAKRTGAEGKRLKEGIDINRGLLVLGNVISALGDSRKRGKVHVPYRDSKLTRMLQDSLGGNSQTLMIACVSPAEVNMHETLNALRYANRARNIQNKPIVNRDRDSALILELKRQVQALAQMLLRIRSGGGGGGSGDFGSDGAMPREVLEQLAAQQASPGAVVDITEATGGEVAPDVARQRCADAEEEVVRLVEENKRLKAKHSEMSEQLLFATAEKEYYRLQVVNNGAADDSHGVSMADGVLPMSTQGSNGELSRDSKVAFTSAVRTYLQEIAGLKEKVTELERTKCMLEIRLTQQKTRHAHTRSASRRLSICGPIRFGPAEELEVEARPESPENQKNASMPLPPPCEPKEVPGAGDGSARSPRSDIVGAELRGLLGSPRGDMSDEEATNFYRAQQEMSMSVVDLSRDIEVREKLVKQLQESVKRYEIMRCAYEQKIKQMGDETARFEGERQKLVKELEELEKRNEDEQKDVHKTLLKRLKEKEAQLQSARRKQDELTEGARIKSRTDAQVKQLGDEIGMMKRQKAELLKRIDAEKRRFEKALREKAQELEAMRRARQRDAMEMQRLNSDIERNRALVKKKDTEVQRMKLHHQHSSSFGTQPQSARGTRRNRYDSRRGSFGVTAEQLKYTEEERMTKKWLDQKLRDVQKKEEAAERLANEYNRRLELLKQKEELELAKTKLFGRRGSVREVILSQTPTSIPDGETDGAGVSTATELDEDEAAALQEVEERIQAVQTQLEFKNQRIEKMERVMASRPEFEEGHDTITQIAQRANTVEQSHMVIRALFDMVVDGRRSRKRQHEQLLEAQDERERLTLLLEEQDGHMDSVKRSYEHALVRQRGDYEEKITQLIDLSQNCGLLGDEAFALLGEAEEAVTGAGSRDGVADGMGQDSADMVEQLRGLCRLYNERNVVLKGQLEHVQGMQDELQEKVTERDARLRKAAEEARDKDDKIKWLEFELRDVRMEYIKLRGVRSPPQACAASSGSRKADALSSAHDVREQAQIRKELGLDSDDDDDEEDEEEEDDVEPPWIKKVTADIECIKAGLIPDAVFQRWQQQNKAGGGERPDGVLLKPSDSPDKDSMLARKTADLSGFNINALDRLIDPCNVFERLTEPSKFTGSAKLTFNKSNEGKTEVELKRERVRQQREAEGAIKQKKAPSTGTSGKGPVHKAALSTSGGLEGSQPGVGTDSAWPTSYSRSGSLVLVEQSGAPSQIPDDLADGADDNERGVTENVEEDLLLPPPPPSPSPKPRTPPPQLRIPRRDEGPMSLISPSLCPPPPSPSNIQRPPTPSRGCAIAGGASPGRRPRSPPTVEEEAEEEEESLPRLSAVEPEEEEVKDVDVEAASTKQAAVSPTSGRRSSTGLSSSDRRSSTGLSSSGAEADAGTASTGGASVGRGVNKGGQEASGGKSPFKASLRVDTLARRQRTEGYLSPTRSSVSRHDGTTSPRSGGDTRRSRLIM